jgi:hypothetical protein
MDEPDPEPIVPQGAHYQYVVDSIHLPTSAAESQELGVNLDGDAQGRPDNAMGQILSVVASALEGYDLNAESAELIRTGAINHLMDLQTVDLTMASNVGLEVLHGRDLDDDLDDNFDGNETFGVDALRGSGLLTGMIVNGQIEVGLGQVPVAFTFPGLGEAFVVPLSHARVVAMIDDDGLSGVIAGGISQQDLDERFVPALHRGFDNIVRRDCDVAPCSSTFAQLLLDLFDNSPRDRVVSLEEVRNNSLIRSLLDVDVDLQRGDDDHYDPQSDGVKDHLSVGIGFTAVPALIAR